MIFVFLLKFFVCEKQKVLIGRLFTKTLYLHRKSENPFEKKPVDTSFPSGKPVETSSFSGTISDVILKSSGKFKNSHGLGWLVIEIFDQSNQDLPNFEHL